MDKLNMMALYRKQIKQWSTWIEQSKPASDYYQTFLNHIYEYTKICITYDDKIVDILITLLKSFTFQVYSKDPEHGQMNPRRRYLFQIIQVLFNQGFIGKHDNYLILLQKQVFLYDKLKQFMQICGDDVGEREDLESIWSAVIQMDMTTFWNLLQENGIKDMFLVQVYQKIQKCNSLTNDESTLSFIQTIQRKKQKIAQPKPNFIRIPSRRQKIPDERKSREQSTVQSFQDIAELNQSRQHFKKNKSRLYDQLWFNADKYQKYRAYIRNAHKSSNSLQTLLTGLAFDQSLFFNENHRPILMNIFRFIEQVQKCLDNYRIVSYQLFGSIRSTLALANQFDIDLTSIRAVSSKGQVREETRELIVNILFAIRRTLTQSNPQWVSKSIVYHFEKLKVPFLKIQFNKEALIRQFKINGIEKMDITIGNKSAIKNSEMISYFARIPQITCFCLLVKLWAKSNSVINTKNPMKGLSSYGVILMCLYYLMQTSQIDFLYASQDFKIGEEEITPNFDNYKIKNIEENFVGFLNFYKQTGPFQRDRKVVCLLKNCDKAAEMFDDEIAFNMYDFIDKSNPGRLRYNDKYPIFEQIDKAIKVVRTKNLTAIRQLITGIA